MPARWKLAWSLLIAVAIAWWLPILTPVAYGGAGGVVVAAGLVFVAALAIVLLGMLLGVGFESVRRR